MGPSSPFHPASERPIRLTLHTESFDNLDQSEADALEALLDLGTMKEIEVLESGQGKFPQIVIETQKMNDLYPVQVNYPDGRTTFSGIRVDGEASLVAFREVSLVLAHEALRHDLFVSACPSILEDATTCFPLRTTNIMPPSAAARMIGLFLRNRRDYHVTSHFLFQGGYHFYLMRYILSGLWRYFSACVIAGEQEGGSPAGLGGAVLTRAERALEARDAIAFDYYGGAPGAIGRIEYHFDYLMLLLNGALDAEARVAFLTYGMRAPKGDANRNFRNDEFLSCLKRDGGTKIAEVAEKNIALLKVIAHLRNTIHGSALKGIQAQTTTPEAFHLEVPAAACDPLGQLVTSTQHRAWGLRDDRQRPMFSPYIFADSAVREVFRVINEIAEATEVDRLVKGRNSGRELMDGPPGGNDPFGEKMGRRLAAIGW